MYSISVYFLFLLKFFVSDSLFLPFALTLFHCFFLRDLLLLFINTLLPAFVAVLASIGDAAILTRIARRLYCVMCFIIFDFKTPFAEFVLSYSFEAHRSFAHLTVFVRVPAVLANYVSVLDFLLIAMPANV